MKNLLRTVIVLVAAVAASFQASAEFRWGPTAGVNMTTLKFKQDLLAVSGGIGPVAGVQGEMMFPGIGFGLDIGAMYSMQGASLDFAHWRVFWETEGAEKRRLYMHTLSIPVNLRFKWTRMNGFEDTLAPFVFGGPVLNVNICHNKMKAMEFPFASFGLQVGIGVEIFKKWQVQGSYTWGMTYAVKAAKLLDYSAREGYWTVRAVYLF